MRIEVAQRERAKEWGEMFERELRDTRHNSKSRLANTTAYSVITLDQCCFHRLNRFPEEILTKLDTIEKHSAFQVWPGERVGVWPAQASVCGASSKHLWLSQAWAN